MTAPATATSRPITVPITGPVGCQTCTRLAETRDSLVYLDRAAEAAVYADALDLHRVGAHATYRTDPRTIVLAPPAPSPVRLTRRARRILTATLAVAALALLVLVNAHAPSEDAGRRLPNTGAAAVQVAAPITGTIYEDDPRWDCRTMGNRRCGTSVDVTACGPLGTACPVLSYDPRTVGDAPAAPTCRRTPHLPWHKAPRCTARTAAATVAPVRSA